MARWTWGTTFCRGWDVAQVENPSSRLSFSSLRTTPDFLHQRRKYNSQVCTLADARTVWPAGVK